LKRHGNGGLLSGWQASAGSAKPACASHCQILNELQACLDSAAIRFWRDKRGHEIDFIVANRRRSPLAIECKWSADAFVPDNILSFRRGYPEGDNIVVCHDIDKAFSRRYGNTTIAFKSAEGFVSSLHVGNKYK
jgi:hypothetical protein